MKFVLPTASKERLDALLSYLGDRADDFKKCFDVQSEYCLMYADLMLRGMESRDLEYGERHHIVPFCFYRMKKKNCDRLAKHVCSNNMTCLTYAEHTYAHYCATMCGIGNMQGKMGIAFLRMYNKAKSMPTNCELISIISSEEFDNARKLIPRIAKVYAEGRTHSWEDPVKARKEYYIANKDEKCKKRKVYYENNKDKCREACRNYRENNKDTLREKQKAYIEANKDKIDAYQISYREAHKDERIVYDKEYYQANKEKKLEYHRNYREANKDLILSRAKKYREAHLDEHKKKCREYHASHKEEQHAKQKEYREAKRAAGYRYRKNPVTGKHEWMFVGIKKEAA